MTFFAQRGAGMTELMPSGGMLVPGSDKLREAIQHTSGGHSRIDFQEFDVVLLVGFLWGYPPSLGHYSLAAARQALFDVTPKTVAINLLHKIRRVSNIPIYVAHQPLRRYLGESEEIGELTPYRRLVEALNAEFMEGYGAVLLHQPPQTIASSFFTRPEFSACSPRLDVGDGDGDKAESSYAAPQSHMNVRYGDIYLSTHLPAIAFRN